jgi:coenzyme F420-reducing hydrogenase alpha subunit
MALGRTMGWEMPDQVAIWGIEMAFRAYDPRFACATHSLPGQMSMIVRVRAPDGTVLSETRRN